MRVSDVVAQTLCDVGVSYVFGLTGSTVLDLLDGIYETGGAVRFISVRHEQVAAHMAEAYARLTHRPGVCLAHAGPGAANLIGGVAAAFKDSSPMLVITGNEDIRRLGRDIWHEWDVCGMFRSITKWTFQVRKPEDIGYALRNAFVKALSGRPGPVHLDIPRDVAPLSLSDEMAAMVEKELVFLRRESIQVPLVRPAADAQTIERASALLLDSRRPVLLAGGGVFWSDAGRELQALAECGTIPVLTTDTARGVIPESHPLSLGVIGRFGNAIANEAARDADLVLSLGCKLSDRATIDWTLFSPEARIIQVDLDLDSLGKHYSPALAIQADVRRFLVDLLADLNSERFGGNRGNYVSGLKERLERSLAEFLARDAPDVVKPQRIVREVREALPQGTIVTVGGGLHAEFANKVCVSGPGTYLKSVGFGPLGYGFSAALGAKVVYPGRPVVALVGDGEFMTVVQDLETAVREQLPVVVVIFNDFSYAAQKLVQRNRFGGRYIGSDVGNPDFALLAQAFGARGERIQTPERFRPALEAALCSEVPVLLDVTVDPTETETMTFFQTPSAREV